MEHTNLTRRVASGLTAALLATGALTGVAVAAAPPAQASAPAASDQAARFDARKSCAKRGHSRMVELPTNRTLPSGGGRSLSAAS